VWPVCQGTGTADEADLVKLGSGQLNPMSLHSALYQAQNRQAWRALDKPHDDDDDDDSWVPQPL